MKSLLLVERIVIESIVKGNSNVNDLIKDTDLNSKLLGKIVTTLKNEKIIREDLNGFKIDKENLKKFTKKESLQAEVKEVFISWVNRYFIEENKETCLKMQKISLSNSEEVIYNEHLRKLNEFVESVKNTSKQGLDEYKTSKQKVVFWGHGQYSNLVESSLYAL